MLYMSEGVEMESSTGGGIGKSLSRALTGQNFMVVDFTFNRHPDNAPEPIPSTTGKLAWISGASPIVSCWKY